MLSAGLGLVGPHGPWEGVWPLFSHKVLIGVPCENSSVLETRGFRADQVSWEK